MYNNSIYGTRVAVTYTRSPLCFSVSVAIIWKRDIYR